MREKASRVRKHGTVVTVTSNGAERIAAVKGIVASKAYGKVDGVMVDLFSASAISKVYDALSETNREKFSGLSIRGMATVAFKLVS